MPRIGYARVSMRTQNDDSQVDELTKAGCKKVFRDEGVSGKLAKRPELDACLAYLRAGDELVITRLSRLARNLRHLLDLAEELRKRDIGLIVIKQGIDSSTPTGRLMINLLGSIDEFQRELIVEGTLEGLESARARGRKGGRREALTDKQWARVEADLDRGARGDVTAPTIGELAEEFKVSRQTIYNTRNRRDKEKAASDD
jgi:DNA invertase Pin-like site-specific DNA recombinase